MTDTLKFTAAERRAIEAGWSVLHTFAEQSMSRAYELRQMLKLEQSERFHDGRTPKPMAQAFLVRWFLKGVTEPDKLARDLAGCRPAAVWAIMWGAKLAHEDAITHEQVDALYAASGAYDAVWERYMDAAHGAIREARGK